MLAYMGETSETKKVDYGSARGFHSYNHGERNVLKFLYAGTPYGIGGRTNLLSHFKRIVDRIPDGILDDVDEIIIKVEEEK